MLGQLQCVYWLTRCATTCALTFLLHANAQPHENLLEPECAEDS